MDISTAEFNELFSRALEVRENAYAPYSDYYVGAALLSATGEIFTGANVENAAYSNTICAERSAIFNAVSEGVKEIRAIVVVTENGGVSCGACRQVISELGKEAELIFVTAQGEITLETTITELLPSSFGPQDISD